MVFFMVDMNVDLILEPVDAIPHLVACVWSPSRYNRMTFLTIVVRFEVWTTGQWWELTPASGKFCANASVRHARQARTRSGS